MRNRNNWLIFIVILVAFSLWIDLSKNIAIINPFNDKPLVERNVDVKLGLDLRGGLQALLEADVPAETVITTEELTNAKNILQNRANALGVSEITMQTAGDRRIVAEFPGITNPEEVVATLKQTALLEFVDMGTSPVPVGTIIKTDAGGASTTAPTAVPTPIDPAAAPTDPAAAPEEIIYNTVMTGAGLETASVTRNTAGQYQISFVLKPDSTNVFGEYTTSHRGQYLAIVLDKQVISTPTINDPITSGEGVITGQFTQEEAQTLAVQLRSGALPIPIKVVESRTIGATLGEESIRKSVLAGIIGLVVVILFMAFNYRLPGLVADLALICYALFSLMLFKLIPVTLTLPGIAGFILSVGMAVDANVLIFERLKEELRGGRNLRQAIDLAWSRAWPSIRDSNTSTLITCVILFLFGNTFGASMVKGFSVTLALGVGISLFTAIIVTRTFLHTVMDNLKLAEHPRWFGL
ncbi:protein translocase subunit SecD [Candidatus Villigracilis saccharophilus]|uniref:protein translocase subunit SecD n=1 Tax=Candidatus Villigracilis saccharophilus TaxID=3140684 RepID=UPI003134FD21|nr:protein translocase subunit SecD [Anaerolineales bacterium]